MSYCNRREKMFYILTSLDEAKSNRLTMIDLTNNVIKKIGERGNEKPKFVEEMNRIRVLITRYTNEYRYTCYTVVEGLKMVRLRTDEYTKNKVRKLRKEFGRKDA